MSEPLELTDEANEFVTEARTAPDQNDQKQLRLTTYEIASIKSGRPIRRFVGFLGKVMDDGRRKIYTTSHLDEGAEVPTHAIRVYRKSPEDQTDGLVRDVIWVDFDADIFYFSRRPGPNRDPDGGGFPNDFRG